MENLNTLFAQVRCLTKLKANIDIELDGLHVKIMEEHNRLNPPKTETPKLEAIIKEIEKPNTTKELLRELRVVKDIKSFTYDFRNIINLKNWEYRKMIDGDRDWRPMTQEDMLENVFIYKVETSSFIDYQKEQGACPIIYPNASETYVVFLTRSIRHSKTKSVFYSEHVYDFTNFCKGIVTYCSFKPQFYIKYFETLN